jgi:hypothetical protein
MRGVGPRGWAVLAAAACSVLAANAQESAPTAARPSSLATGYTSQAAESVPAALGQVTLAAQLTPDGSQIPRGLVWSVFGSQPGPDGKLPLIASARGGSAIFQLEPGSYLVHASFGRAGATKRITVGRETLGGGRKARPALLTFEIREARPDEKGDHPLIVRGVSSDTVVRLKAGTYQIVSRYGDLNAVTRSDIKVEAGKLIEATIEHRAAELTIKLVREHGGEAIADTSWSIISDSGDPVAEVVGAYASVVLAQGEYTVIAKNRDRLYQKDIMVEPGRNEEVELILSETAVDQSDQAD